MIIAVVLLITVSSEGQVGNILRNRINKAINKRVDEKIDSTVDKSVNEAGQDVETEAEKEAGDQTKKGFNFGGIMGGKVTLKYDEKYSFNNSIYMQTEVYDKKDVIKMDYNIFYVDDKPYAGIESKMVVETKEGASPMFTSMIADGINRCFIILTDIGSIKTGIITEVPEDDLADSQEIDDPGRGTITKTGNTKIIAGYRCDEYLYKDNESNDYGKLWVTKDLIIKTDKRTWSQAGLPSYYGHPSLTGGVVLATEAYDEKNNLIMKSETREIKTGINHTISTAGYPLRQVNFSQARKQNK